MNDTGAVGRYLEPVTCHAAVCPNNEYWHSRRVLHFLFCLSHKKVLIPQQTGFFPEFRDDFPGIPGDLLLYTGASKISMDVAEPLPSVHLDIIQDMVTTLHHLTPVAPLLHPISAGIPTLYALWGCFPPPQADVLRRCPYTL